MWMKRSLKCGLVMKIINIHNKIVYEDRMSSDGKDGSHKVIWHFWKWVLWNEKRKKRK